MKQDNKKIGKLGEDLASQFLTEKGFKVVERNFQNKYGEIDIICMDRETLVFVEVKTKVGHDFGEPEEMVSKSKLKQVERMGEIYCLLKFERRDLPVSNCGAGSDFVMPDSIRHPEKWLDSGSVPGMTNLWRGRCRVDVVGVVLKEDLSVERIRHYEAVY